jgi:hypothetical protein
MAEAKFELMDVAYTQKDALNDKRKLESQGIIVKIVPKKNDLDQHVFNIMGKPKPKTKRNPFMD